MATTTIRITEEAYESLRALKGDDESFSDVVLRLAEAEQDKMKGFGAWSDSELREAVYSHRETLDDVFEDRQDALSGH